MFRTAHLQSKRRLQTVLTAWLVEVLLGFLARSCAIVSFINFWPRSMRFETGARERRMAEEDLLRRLRTAHGQILISSSLLTLPNYSSQLLGELANGVCQGLYNRPADYPQSGSRRTIDLEELQRCNRTNPSLYLQDRLLGFSTLP
jgi:hypothetical protein